LFRTFSQMPDQAVALICTAWIERSLERVILSRMTRLTKSQRADLFVGLAPLATLTAKIRLAFALKIIGPSAVTDLEIIKDIRNQFAHSFHPLTFQTRAIALACRRLKTPERTYYLSLTKAQRASTEIDPIAANDPRTRFATACG